jgi:NAD(P)-dependent dehydrogenase (short-subunit alcohol dehydrogenase family)
MILPFQIDLRDRVAVVTGGGGVLCSVLAEALGRCGARVAVLERDAAAAERVAAALRAQELIALGVVADVLDPESLRAAAARTLEELGPCDLLINGAGGNHPSGTTTRERLDLAELTSPAPGQRSFFDLDPAGIDGVMRLNFLGTLLPTQVFARQMIGRAGCGVINIASLSSFTPLTRVPAYSAAKAAVANFTQWLAVHLSAVGVRVNALAPGFFLTHQNRALLIDPQSGQLTPRAQRILDHTPMGRFGEPRELVGTLLWLASDAASGFVSGLIIPVDGGFSAYAGV